MTTTTPRDTTFRAFTPEQAAAYASGRGGAYPEPLYQTIIDYHDGKRELCLDVGTGPGKAVWDFLKYFDRCIGCDASVEMIEQAKRDAIRLGVSDKTQFVTSDGERCAAALAKLGVEEGQVDAITVAMAAHWLDLPAFYISAAKCLRPGGTLAMWTASSYYCHPSVPNHKAIQAALSHLEDDLLGPYMTSGSLLSKGAYEKLPLPWTIDNASTSCTSTNASTGDCPFDKASFERSDWDRNGIPSSPPLPDGSPGPYLLGREETLESGATALSSSGPVIRWRQAHREKANTEEDPVVMTAKRLREIMDGNERFMTGNSCSLLLMRRV